MNSSFFKWIGAFLGFIITKRIWGAFIGFFIGGWIDSLAFTNTQRNNFNSSQDIFNYYQKQNQGYDFPTILLILSAAVMKADGKVLKSELSFVKQFLTTQFGNNFTNQHLATLKSLINQNNPLPVQEVCLDIRNKTQIETRVQLMYYLLGIAKSDGEYSTKEQNLLFNIANWMNIASHFTSIENMFKKDLKSDYKVLEISENATDQEIKRAYRKLAVLYHPDKVAQMGSDFQKGAKEKFQRLQDAYENIKKERGFN